MNHPKLQIFLVALLIAVGLAAVVGGVALVLRPDGSLLWMSPALLVHTGFRTFLFPGLMLIVLGVIEIGAAILLRRRPERGVFAAAIAGGAVVLWIAVQSAIVQTIHPLQVFGFLLGAAVFIIAYELHREARHREPART